jgi:hypothetical protein
LSYLARAALDSLDASSGVRRLPEWLRSLSVNLFLAANLFQGLSAEHLC